MSPLGNSDQNLKQNTVERTTFSEQQTVDKIASLAETHKAVNFLMDLAAKHKFASLEEALKNSNKTFWFELEDYLLKDNHAHGFGFRFGELAMEDVPVNFRTFSPKDESLIIALSTLLDSSCCVLRNKNSSTSFFPLSFKRVEAFCPLCSVADDAQKDIFMSKMTDCLKAILKRASFEKARDELQGQDELTLTNRIRNFVQQGNQQENKSTPKFLLQFIFQAEGKEHELLFPLEFEHFPPFSFDLNEKVRHIVAAIEKKLKELNSETCGFEIVLFDMFFDFQHLLTQVFFARDVTHLEAKSIKEAAMPAIIPSTSTTHVIKKPKPLTSSDENVLNRIIHRMGGNREDVAAVSKANRVTEEEMKELEAVYLANKKEADVLIAEIEKEAKNFFDVKAKEFKQQEFSASHFSENTWFIRVGQEFRSKIMNKNRVSLKKCFGTEGASIIASSCGFAFRFILGDKLKQFKASGKQERLETALQEGFISAKMLNSQGEVFSRLMRNSGFFEGETKAFLKEQSNLDPIRQLETLSELSDNAEALKNFFKELNEKANSFFEEKMLKICSSQDFEQQIEQAVEEFSEMFSSCLVNHYNSLRASEPLLKRVLIPFVKTVFLRLTQELLHVPDSTLPQQIEESFFERRVMSKMVEVLEREMVRGSFKLHRQEIVSFVFLLESLGFEKEEIKSLAAQIGPENFRVMFDFLALKAQPSDRSELELFFDAVLHNLFEFVAKKTVSMSRGEKSKMDLEKEIDLVCQNNTELLIDQFPDLIKKPLICSITNIVVTAWLKKNAVPVMHAILKRHKDKKEATATRSKIVTKPHARQISSEEQKEERGFGNQAHSFASQTGALIDSSKDLVQSGIDSFSRGFGDLLELGRVLTVGPSARGRSDERDNFGKNLLAGISKKASSAKQSSFLFPFSTKGFLSSERAKAEKQFEQWEDEMTASSSRRHSSRSVPSASAKDDDVTPSLSLRPVVKKTKAQDKKEEDLSSEESSRPVGRAAKFLEIMKSKPGL